MTEVLDNHNAMMKDFAGHDMSVRKAKAGALYTALTSDVAKAYPGEDVAAYLKAGAEFTAERFGGLLHGEEEASQPENPLAAMMGQRKISVASLFDVQVLVENAGKTGAPVVVENFPKYENVFGSIEEKPDGKGGEKKQIKAGALLKANGGYLIMKAWDVAKQPGVVQTLVEALKNGEVEITDEIPGKLRLGGRQATHREKVKINTKVVLVGDGEINAMLHHYLGNDFAEQFHGRAQFDRTMENPAGKADNLNAYVGILAKLVRTGAENIMDLASGAVGKVVEFAAWLAGDQRKLTTQFRDVRNLLREATYFAKQDGAAEVGRSTSTRPCSSGASARTCAAARSRR